MKRYNLAILALALGGTAGSNAWAGEYIVKYKDQQPYFINGRMGMQITDSHEAGRLLKVVIDDKSEKSALVDLMKNPDIEYVVENFKLRAIDAKDTGLNIQALREQWAIKKVNAEQAWAKAGNKGSRNVLVAVIDTGTDYNHESLKENMVTGYDYRDGDADPMDLTSAQNPGHGTHCAGIIGATGLKDNGIVGLSPEVSIMPLRFLGADGSGDLMNGIKAIDHAIEKGAEVISASWGANVPKSQAQPLIDAVKRASDKNVIFVMAAGNDGKNNDNSPTYPANANFENTITVAASNSSDQKPSWSNYGRATVDIAAPGDGIMSTLPSGKYGNLSGTSMATPLVAGLVGLLKAQDMALTGQQARSIMQVTGAKVGIQTACDCRIDAAAAVTVVKDKALYVAPAAITLAPNATQKFTAVNAKGAVKFVSSAADVATITEDGTLTAVKDGQTVITATDADGKTASTLNIYVGASKDDGGGGGDGPQPPGMGECPIQDEMLCQGMCMILPDLPFCKKN